MILKWSLHDCYENLKIIPGCDWDLLPISRHIISIVQQKSCDLATHAFCTIWSIDSYLTLCKCSKV